MVALATTYSLLRYWFIVLTPRLPALLQNKTGQLNKHGASVCCFGLCHAFKFWQLTVIFSAFHRLYLEITLFYTTPSWQITSRKPSFTVNSTKRWTPLKFCINRSFSDIGERSVYWAFSLIHLIHALEKRRWPPCFPLRFLSFSRVD